MKTLRDAYADYFPIGVAIAPYHLESHADVVDAQFNSLTAENCMKFESLQPREGEFHFEGADRIAEYAVKKGYKLRGHCLVWHQQTPAWVFAGKDGTPGAAGRELLLERMRVHVGTVMKRYKGAVYCWDVVNEAVCDAVPEDAAPGTADTIMRHSPWRSGIGDDYAELAFRIARAADPGARLFYNDYNEADPPKRERIASFVAALLAKGVPVDGLGMQGHYGPQWPSVDAVEDSIIRFAKLGLPIQVTEFDLSMYSWNRDPSPLTAPTAEMLDNQARRFDELFALWRRYRKSITGVTFWTPADDHTWLDHAPLEGRKNWPGLFDGKHRPKLPAFERVVYF